jgi:excisionase family DNA binding protein
MSVADAQRRFLTLDLVAEQFQVSGRTVERLVAAEIMPSVRVGGSRRVPADELDEWIGLRRVSDDGSRRGQLRADTAPAERRETPEPRGESSSRQPAGDTESGRGKRREPNGVTRSCVSQGGGGS